MQVNNNKHSGGGGGGGAADHGVAGCEVRTTHRSQESMSHFAKAAQTWCQNPTVFSSPVPAVREEGTEEQEEEG